MSDTRVHVRTIRMEAWKVSEAELEVRGTLVASATEFDDMLEELDPEFQKSLKVAAKEYRAGKTISLQDHLKRRLAARRAG